MLINLRLAWIFAALSVAACGDDSTTSSGAGGSGGEGGSGAGGGQGGEALCPAGSHPGEASCESDLTSWDVGPSLEYARDHHVTWIGETSAGNFLYAAFGAGQTSPPRSIERAPIAEDGSLAAFEDIGDVPEGRIGPGFAQEGSSFIIVGGLDSSSNAAVETWVGTIGDDGAITFADGPPLATARYHDSTVIVNGYAFALGGLFQEIVGGMPTQEVLASVERASFDGNSLGAWEPAGDLPEPRTHLAAFAYASAIFVVGGGSALPARDDILRATVDEAGALGGWEVVGTLPEGRATSSTVVFLDRLHVIAGMKELTGMEQPTVFRADLGGDGSVGAFESLLPLPRARAHAHQTPLLNGKLYSVGGSIDHEVQPDVFIGTLE